jgi:two-component system sensor histidine kinase PilS (NtrC family)
LLQRHDRQDGTLLDWHGSQKGLLARLRSLMLVRAAVGTALLSALTLIGLRSEGPLSLFPFLFIGTLYLLTFIYSLLLGRVQNLAVFAIVQIIGDLLLISGVLVATGGSTSPFSVLYCVSIVSGSILLHKPGGYLAAGCSCLLLGGLTGLESFHVLPRSPILTPDRSALELSVQLSQLFLDFFGYFLIGHLSGHLAERLRRSSELLDRSNEMLAVQRQNLLELRHFNHHMLQSVSSGLLTTDLQGLITSANRAALDLVESNFDTLAGRSVFEIFPALEDRRIAQACRDKVSIDVFLESGGSKRTLEVVPSVFWGLSGEAEGYIFVLRDITELRRLEALEKEADKLAALGELASTIAHEIRNPLASMRGSVELLSKELALNGPNRRLMEIVLRESDRLNRLVTDFLSYARQRPPRLEIFDLSRLLEEIVLLLRNDEACRGVEIRLEVHALEIPLALDPEQMRQVIWNLAQNGLRAMRGRGTLVIGTREVLMREGTRDEGLCLWCARHRMWHGCPGAGPDLQAVPWSQRLGHGTWPGDREASGDRASRRDRDREQAWRRHHGPRLSALAQHR